MKRMGRSNTRVVLVCLLLLIISTALFQPSFYIISPGETRSASELLVLNEEQQSSNESNLFYTTVYAKPTNLSGAISSLFNRDDALLLERQLLNGMPIEAYQKNAELMMEQSNYTALSAAYHYLHVPYRDVSAGLYVHKYEEVENLTNFQHGDRLWAIELKEGTTQVSDEATLLKDVRQQLELNKQVVFVVERNEQLLELKLSQKDKLTPETENELLDWLNVSRLTAILRPIAEREADQLMLGSTEVGGSSAGLAMALTMIEALQSNTLKVSSPIAATGTISVEGQIGPIGSLQQKVVSVSEAGIALFLVPRQQEKEAIKKAESINSAVTVKGVSTIAEAIEVITMYSKTRLND